MARNGDGLHERAGYWQARYRAGPGKYPYYNTKIKVTTKKPPQEAVLKRAEFLQRLANGLPAASEQWTTDRAAEAYLASIADREKVSAETRVCYRDWLKQARRLLG